MELLNVTERYFITGTDTEVGKTTASIALLQAAQRVGFIAIGYKPIASDSAMTNEGLRNSDALAFQRNNSIMLSYDMINPYSFAEPTSPHIASINENKPISFTVLSTGLRALEEQADWILVEGAGGWFTPITDRTTFADWVIMEQLSVILVVGIKLGCINHALLTAFAVQKSGLYLSGWIANNVIVSSKRHMEYVATIKRMLSVPFLGEIPNVSSSEEGNLGKYIDMKQFEI